MPEIVLPPTIAVVVNSEVIGKTAISVPATEQVERSGKLCLSVERAEIEDEIDRRETSYLDSHGKAAPEDYFTVPAQPFRDHMKVAIEADLENWDSIADRMGWWRTANDRGSGRRANGERVRYYVMQCDLIPGDIAKDLAEAMNMEPHEVGL